MNFLFTGQVVTPRDSSRVGLAKADKEENAKIDEREAELEKKEVVAEAAAKNAKDEEKRERKEKEATGQTKEQERKAAEAPAAEVKTEVAQEKEEQERVLCDLVKVRIDRIFNVPDPNALYCVVSAGIAEKKSSTYEAQVGKNGELEVLLREELHDVPFARDAKGAPAGVPLTVWQASSGEELGSCVVNMSKDFEKYSLELHGKATGKHIRVQVVSKMRRLTKSQATQLGLSF